MEEPDERTGEARRAFLVARCRSEMARIEALPEDYPPESFPALGWVDWWLEMELMEGRWP